MIGELRSWMAQGPSQALFEWLCVWMGDEPLEEELLGYLLGHVRQWPEDIERSMPRSWQARLSSGLACPQAALCADMFAVEPDLDLLHVLLHAPELRNLRTLDVYGLTLRDPDAALEILFGSPHLGSVRVLDLSGWMLSPQALTRMAQQDTFANVREVCLAGMGLTGEHLDGVIPWLRGRPIEALDLGGNELDAVALERFVQEGAPPTLRELNFYDLALPDAAFEALAGLSKLEKLSLPSCGIGRRGAAAMSKGLEELRELNVKSCMLTWEDFEPLLSLPKLERLHAPDNLIGVPKASPVWEERIGTLRELDLSHNNLGCEGVRVLMGCPGLSNLEILRLDDNGVLDTGAGILAKAPVLGQLKELHLLGRVETWGSGVSVCEIGATALATSETLTRLEVLQLDLNDLTPEGMRALLESTTLVALRELSCRVCNIQPDAFGGPGGGLPALETLDISACNLQDEDILPLAKDPWSSRLKTLRLKYNQLKDPSFRALWTSESMKSLVCLDLEHNQIEAKGWGSWLGTSGSLRELTMSQNALDASGIRALGEELRALHVEACGLGLEDIEVLVSESPRLEVLNVSENRIGRAGLRALLTSRPLQELRVLSVNDIHAEEGEEEEIADDVMALARAPFTLGPLPAGGRWRRLEVEYTTRESAPASQMLSLPRFES